MENDKLSDDVIEQIKDFKYHSLTEEQRSLIDELILNEELKGCYLRNGLCEECNQPKISYLWCHPCHARHFKDNFKNWTSGNDDIDEFIQKNQLNATYYDKLLEWIDFDRFENVEYLSEGGFGSISKAIWKDGYIRLWDTKNNQWKRVKSGQPVALKYLHNSQNIKTEFLNEVLSYNKVRAWVVRCYGITKDPETNNFIMVMDLRKGGLRQYLNNSFTSLGWKKKLYILYCISLGLKEIHENELIHQDFHCGNILSDFDDQAYITDMGLSRPVGAKTDNKQVFGVLPYVAPEVLRGKDYTQPSDIYGFGIIAYEVCTGLPPYYNMAHQENLAISICQGLRPNSVYKYKIPQLILDLIQRSWDPDPLKRPEANELRELLWDLWDKSDKQDSEIYRQVKEADEINKKSIVETTTVETISSNTHPQAVYTSRLLDYKNLPESQSTYSISESLCVDFTN